MVLPQVPNVMHVDGRRTDSNNGLVTRHPLSIKPSGNAYAAGKNLKWAAGAFSCLPDELILQVFEYLDATTLTKVATCKALYAFSRSDDLWKKIAVE